MCARIIEGCNAISVIILFAAFIFAFAQVLGKNNYFIYYCWNFFNLFLNIIELRFWLFGYLLLSTI